MNAPVGSVPLPGWTLADIDQALKIAKLRRDRAVALYDAAMAERYQQWIDRLLDARWART